jgi:serine phosphatase RsbU (regulator of sigma subunit)/anti-sigma regulatory factor (Ser/Thr protein kinase)
VGGIAEEPPGLADNLRRVTEAALAHLDLEKLLQELLVRVDEILGADTAAILLLDQETNELAARAARGLEEEVERGFRVPVGKGFAGRVAATRAPVVIADLAPGDAVNPLLYEKKIRSLLGVPLIVEGDLIGVLHVGSFTQRPFTDEDVVVLQVVADRVALAIAHATAFENERRARAEAERALARLNQLQGITDSALAQMGLDELLRVLLERVVEMLAADTAAILLVDDDGTSLVARAAKGLEEEVERGFRLPIGQGFAGRVAAERKPITVPVKQGLVVNPLMFEKGVKRLLGVPLIVERRLIGVLHVGTLTEREFTADDADLLQAVGDRAALAIEHDRLVEQRRVVELLQRSLLPSQLPQPSGLSFAARYMPAAAKRLVGGDWFDVIELPDGRVGVAIGDVVGHGLEAATLMGALRTALQAYALQGLSPAATVPLLARFASSSAGRGQMATYVYGIVDVERRSFTFVNGSHPPPIVVRPDGTASVVASDPLPPLGARAAAMPDERRVDLEPGTAIVLYTDGLVERRGERLATRQALLHDAAAAAPAEPDLLCEALIERMLGGQPPEDDVAVLALQRTATADEEFDLRIAARPEELAAVRRLLRGWLVDLGADRRAIEAVLLASGEACTNAVEHAYGPGDQTFRLRGWREGDDVVLVIRDDGRWRPPRGQNRGRGLGLMETFMDTVEVAPDESGTEVRMRRRISG